MGFEEAFFEDASSFHGDVPTYPGVASSTAPKTIQNRANCKPNRASEHFGSRPHACANMRGVERVGGKYSWEEADSSTEGRRRYSWEADSDAPQRGHGDDGVETDSDLEAIPVTANKLTPN